MAINLNGLTLHLSRARAFQKGEVRVLPTKKSELGHSLGTGAGYRSQQAKPPYVGRYRTGPN